METMDTIIKERLAELRELVERNPLTIPVAEVAAFLHTKPESIQATIDNGRCPFAIGWQKRLAGRAAYCIPTLSFYLWITQARVFPGAMV